MKREYHLKAHERKAITAIKIAIDENPLERINLLELAKNAGIGRNTLVWGFKLLCGTTIQQYIRQKKLEKVREMLDEGLTLRQIANQYGYMGASNFSAAYKKLW